MFSKTQPNSNSNTKDHKNTGNEIDARNKAIRFVKGMVVGLIKGIAEERVVK